MSSCAQTSNFENGKFDTFKRTPECLEPTAIVWSCVTPVRTVATIAPFPASKSRMSLTLGGVSCCTWIAPQSAAWLQVLWREAANLPDRCAKPVRMSARPVPRNALGTRNNTASSYAPKPAANVLMLAGQCNSGIVVQHLVRMRLFSASPL